MRFRFGSTNGAYYEPAYDGPIDDDSQPERLREPYWHTDVAPAYDGIIHRDPVANWHAFAHNESLSLGLNPTPYYGKRHTYVDDGGPPRS